MRKYLSSLILASMLVTAVAVPGLAQDNGTSQGGDQSTTVGKVYAPIISNNASFGQPTNNANNGMMGGDQKMPAMWAMKRTTQADRVAAAERAKAVREAAQAAGMQAAAVAGPGMQPDYFSTTPNFAYSELPTLQNGAVVQGTGIRKFVSALPGLTAAGANDIGQYISVAKADTTTYADADYYVIAAVEYKEQMHKDLAGPTKLRGYVQLASPGMPGTVALLDPDTNAPILLPDGTPAMAVEQPRYLGPIIVGQRDRGVRILFRNLLPPGAGGDLFIPSDVTSMGAGLGPNGLPAGTVDANKQSPLCASTPKPSYCYPENRSAVHLHGGLTPWISDGTAHQWVTPAGETSTYIRGVSVQNVPDMPDPGPGGLTLHFPNQQSARLMFYHDHSYGITRLNVYAGTAGGYLLRDTVEQTLIANGVIPAAEIPLVIQDKTFVPPAAQLQAQDPTWDTTRWGAEGNLWYPHVYMPNENPETGVNPMGRWDYGAWTVPAFPAQYGPVPNAYANPALGEPATAPGTPWTSVVPEAYGDTPLVNGQPYPYLVVQPQAYRFRILNAANDRYWNLQLYKAASNAPMWDVNGNLADGLAGEVAMVPALPTAGFPATWPTDGRQDGVPDPAAMGPNFIQIGTEGGMLPAPVVIPNQPIDWAHLGEAVDNISSKALLLGPAERADAIVDFSQFAGQTLILYSDAPAPVPSADPRYDHYTGDPDFSYATGDGTGGAPTTQLGYGPNVRTIMQIRVAAAAPAPAFNLSALNAAFSGPSGVFAMTQEPVIVPQAAYNSAYGATFTDNFVGLTNTSFTFVPKGAAAPLTIGLNGKAVWEDFEKEYGRLNTLLGVQLPDGTGAPGQAVGYGYADPTTEILNDSVTVSSPVAGDGTQLWKITHNGVDTHPIHFHLFNVQVVNRIRLDGTIVPPDPNELGWKETVRFNPLETTIIAIRPVAAKLTYGVPNSIRPLNPALPIGATMGFENINPSTGQPVATPVTNQMTNFGWEYVWHCHMLSHEENDMMRPMQFNTVSTTPPGPLALAANSIGTTAAAPVVNLSWNDPTPKSAPTTLGNPANEIGFRVWRAGSNGAWAIVGTQLANVTTYADRTVLLGATYNYSITAFNVGGALASTVMSVTAAVPPVAPAGFVATVQTGPKVALKWAASAGATGYVLTRTGGAGPLSVAIAKGTTTSYNDASVAVGTTYTYTLVARNGAYKPPVDSARAVAAAVVPLPAPGSLRVTTRTANSIGLAWNAVAAPGQIVVYDLQRSTDNRTWTTIATNLTLLSYNSTGLASRTTYYYQVRAKVNATGVISAWSASVSSRTN